MEDITGQIEKRFKGKTIKRDNNYNATNLFVTNVALYSYQFSGILEYNTPRGDTVMCKFSVDLADGKVSAISPIVCEKIVFCDMKSTGMRKIPTPKKVYKMLADLLEYVTTDSAINEVP